jgi:hypothetical protein
MFFWTIHKIFEFVVEVVVHLLLGLGINKMYTQQKNKNKSKTTRFSKKQD